ncbi:MAG TPA: hypothetical protein VD886_21780, partial [Herpetosiphonaceae bacterium]|nr:hypothetical protein [Herpetosiphonaceae bacterium]
MHNSAPLIGVLAPLTGGFYFGSIIDGIAGVAQAAGAQVLAIQTNEAGFTQPDPLAAPHFAVPLGWRHIDGWVIIVDAVDEAYLWQIKRSGKPLVLISHQ